MLELSTKHRFRDVSIPFVVVGRCCCLMVGVDVDADADALHIIVTGSFFELFVLQKQIVLL
jgi:hypothetical protein